MKAYQIIEKLTQDTLAEIKKDQKAGEGFEELDFSDSPYDILSLPFEPVDKANFYVPFLDRKNIVVTGLQTLPECRFMLVEILQMLCRRHRHVAVFLDGIHEKYQGVLQNLMRGQLSKEQAYLLLQNDLPYATRNAAATIKLFSLVEPPSFEDPLKQDTARLDNLHLMAADCPGDTQKRNQHLKAKVSQWHQHFDGVAVWFVGEGRLLDLNIAPDKENAVIFQASTDVFERLFKDGISPEAIATYQSCALDFGGNLFATTSVPPLVRLDSYQTWSRGFDIWPGYPPNTWVQNLRRNLKLTLDLPVDTGAFSEPVIYALADPRLFLAIEAGEFDGAETEQLLHHIARRESLFLPTKNLIYLATLDAFHVGEEVGHSLRSAYSRENQERLSPKGKLYFHAIHEAAGYFSSKVADSSRVPDEKEGRVAYKQARSLFRHASDLRFKTIGDDRIHKKAHLAGYGLGELMFAAHKNKEVAIKDLRRLFTTKANTDKRAFVLFKNLFQKSDLLESVRSGQRFREFWQSGTIKEKLYQACSLYFIFFFMPAILWREYKPELIALPLDWPQALRFDLYLTLSSAFSIVGLSFILSNRSRIFKTLASLLKRMLGNLSTQEVFLLAAFSSICEEVFFRGCLLPTIGLTASSVLFGGLHFIPDKRFLPWTAFAICAGFVFGLLYIATESIAAPILAHFLINFVNMLWLTKRLES